MILMKLRYIHIFLFFVIAFFLAKAVMHDHKMEKYTQQSLSEVAVLARKTVKVVNTEHLRCLATNIYWEAAGEPFMGQVAVARVVVNRVKHGFASNPCKVVYQATYVEDINESSGVKKICQFSWVCENKSLPPGNNIAYKQAENIAYKVLSENKWSEVIPSNILFFHNAQINVGWKYKKEMIIGNHVFYKK